MNQKQREFLLKSIEDQYRKERDALNARTPKAPSLNNYLIASILDGSIQIKTSGQIKLSIQDRVLKLGKTEALIETRSRYSSSDKEETDVIHLPASVVFEYPDNFRAAREQYEKDRDAWKAEAEALEASMNAMRIKVQLGSDAALAALVNQADELCSMSLRASSSLLLKN